MDSEEIREAFEKWTVIPGNKDEAAFSELYSSPRDGVALGFYAGYQAALSTIYPEAKTDAETIVNLIADLRYIGGIIERGTGKPLDQKIPITRQVLEYVKKLEAFDPEAIRRECEDIIRQWASVGTLLNENVESLCAAILSAEPTQDDGAAETEAIIIATFKAQRDELLARLKESTEQLDAMSTSASHAASWVNPNSDATDIQVAKNRAAIANAERSEG